MVAHYMLWIVFLGWPRLRLHPHAVNVNRFRQNNLFYGTLFFGRSLAYVVLVCYALECSIS